MERKERKFDSDKGGKFGSSDRGDRGDRGSRDNRDSRDSSGGDDKDGFRRRRNRPPVDLTFDYKDMESMKPFLSEGGKIVPSRVNRLSRLQQRSLTREVKRARQLALLPLSDRHDYVY